MPSPLVLILSRPKAGWDLRLSLGVGVHRLRQICPSSVNLVTPIHVLTFHKICPSSVFLVTPIHVVFFHKICPLSVCLFVCFNGRPGEANWYCNPEKRASRLASRTKSSCRDITHIQNNFMISSRLCSCTSLPGKGGGTWEGRIITEGGRSCKTHKCQNQLLSRSDGLRICCGLYLGTIVVN